MTSKVGQGNPEGGFLDLLRQAALIAVVVGAAGSVGLMIRAGRGSPQRFLLVLIGIWVISPFIVLVLATLVSRRWSVLTRAALYSVMLVITMGSLAAYGYDAVRPRKSQPAAMFVAVPPVAWLLIATVVPLAALTSRRRGHRKAAGENR